MTARLLRSFAILLIALTAFLGWMHPGTLDITNIGWALRDDWGTGVTGFNAYLKSGTWPGTYHPLMMAPEGAHLLLTDSIPLLALLVKPFAWLLPSTGVQLLGWWLLACLVLQAAFAHALVRRYAADFMTAWLGTALLVVLPALFNRYPHPSLCAHWTILWALWVFVDVRRARQAGWWLVVIAIAGLIHSYLLLMVGAIWASALLERLWQRDWRNAAVQVVAAGLVAAVIVTLHGAIGQGYVPTHTYGAFPMALDALINPAHPGYTALLPTTPDDQGRGFEGYQYLGAGLLVVTIAAIGVRVARIAPEPRGPALRRLAWLLPAFAVLTLLAITHGVLLHGEVLFKLPLPRAVIDALDPVRASGRLFWPVAYTGLFAAIATIERLKLPTARLILASALMLQIIDIAPMLAAIRADTSEAGQARLYRRATDPRWAALIDSASAVEFQPATDRPDQKLLAEVGWRAMLACRPMRFSYVARWSRTDRDRLASDRAAFVAGRIDPSRLYVLFPGEPVPAPLASRARAIDGVTVIPPTVAAPPPGLCGNRRAAGGSPRPR